MSAFSRAMIPVVAIGVGTWFGLGRPDVRSAFATSTRLFTSAAASAAGAMNRASPSLVPPLDRGPPPVDPSAIGESLPPWPPLNPGDRLDRAWLLSEGPLHPKGDGRRLVTFTFDDGPFPETAPTLLRILGDHRIRATFFFIGGYLTGEGRRAEESRLWARRIADAGHYVGNHTLDHRRLTSLGHAAALAEIDDSAAAIEGATGRRPCVFRPPFGALDPWLESALADRRQELVLWNIDVQDIKRSDPDDIARSIEEQLQYKRGGIVLLHDMHLASIKGFARLVRSLEANKWDPEHPERPGWDIVDLAEYVRATAASPQPYETREELEHAREAAAAPSPTELER